MKNALYYYYGISASNIYKNDRFYHFILNDRKYILYKHDLSYEQLEKAYHLCYYLLKYNIPVHQMIKTKMGSYDIDYNGVKYVLMLINFDTDKKEVTLDDVIDFSNKSIVQDTPISYAKVWSEKVDYIEYQVSEMGKGYDYIRDSLGYFIGLAENAIFLNRYTSDGVCSIGHKKMSVDPYSFYNPLNLVIDSRIRDVAEYFKIQILHRKFNPSVFLICTNELNNNEKLLLFDRILFPNYYFDLIERCLLEEKSDCDIKKIIGNVTYFEEQLKYVYETLPNTPTIEWIEKT